MALTTTTMRTVRRHLSWLDHCGKASEELQGPSSVCREGNGAFNALVENCLQDNTKFFNKIDQNPNFDFLLLPSSIKGTLNVFHCDFLFEDAGRGGNLNRCQWNAVQLSLEGHFDETFDFSIKETCAEEACALFSDPPEPHRLLISRRVHKPPRGRRWN